MLAEHVLLSRTASPAVLPYLAAFPVTLPETAHGRTTGGYTGAEAPNTAEVTSMKPFTCALSLQKPDVSAKCKLQHRLGKSKHTNEYRLKPIKPIEISIGAWIQDPRLPKGLWAESWILDLGPD